MPFVWVTLWGESECEIRAYGKERAGMTREVGEREVRGRKCLQKMGVAENLSDDAEMSLQ